MAMTLLPVSNADRWESVPIPADNGGVLEGDDGEDEQPDAVRTTQAKAVARTGNRKTATGVTLTR